jgi:hypothetical protein
MSACHEQTSKAHVTLRYHFILKWTGDGLVAAGWVATMAVTIATMSLLRGISRSSGSVL